MLSCHFCIKLHCIISIYLVITHGRVLYDYEIVKCEYRLVLQRDDVRILLYTTLLMVREGKLLLYMGVIAPQDFTETLTYHYSILGHTKLYLGYLSMEFFLHDTG